MDINNHVLLHEKACIPCSAKHHAEPISISLQTAAKKRCRKHMLETDEFLSSNSEGFLMDHVTISTAYLKMKNLCVNIGSEIQADIKIHNQHILPRYLSTTQIETQI